MRIIFAEHIGADGYAKGVAGYEAQCDDLRGFVFEPLRAYLAGELARAGLAEKDVNEGLQTFMGRHYFSRSQWTLPTRQNYERLRQLFNERGRRPAPPMEEYHPADGLWRKYHPDPSPELLQADYGLLRADYELLRADYELLRADYEELKQEYEELRRPFAVEHDSQYTDVWDFTTVPGYAGKHPCEKPLPLLEHIIAASSRPGGVVLDTFMGSGSTGDACRRLGRRFIGMELDPQWLPLARARIGDATALFDRPKQASSPFSRVKRTVRPPGAGEQASMFGD